MPEETLDCAYQPPDGCETLHRFRFLPHLGEAPYPTVLMLPPDVFTADYGDRGVPSELWATEDLRNAGFMVFQVDHRLAPPLKLPDQTSEGHAPDQTDDLKRQILAALADPQCDGTIYLVGGSAGGTLALWVALDSAAGAVTGWNESVRAHIKAVVSLSGPTNFCNLMNPGNIPPNAITRFQNTLDNYVDLPDGTGCDADPQQKLNHASPYWLVTNGATSSPPPIRLYTTDGDTVPYAQEDDMYIALHTRFPALDLVKYRMSYKYTDPNHHAYTYWHSVNDDLNGGNECVSQQVINFLQAHP
ncbi:MAG: hypothetical protein ABI016_12915 [Chthoniobacterales bacterium]